MYIYVYIYICIYGCMQAIVSYKQKIEKRGELSDFK